MLAWVSKLLNIVPCATMCGLAKMPSPAFKDIEELSKATIEMINAVDEMIAKLRAEYAMPNTTERRKLEIRDKLTECIAARKIKERTLLQCRNQQNSKDMTDEQMFLAEASLATVRERVAASRRMDTLVRQMGGVDHIGRIADELNETQQQVSEIVDAVSTPFDPYVSEVSNIELQNEVDEMLGITGSSTQTPAIYTLPTQTSNPDQYFIRNPTILNSV